MPVFLLDLPNEVLDSVAALLPRRDIKTLRSTCRRLSLVASHYLYSTLYLSCHDYDLYVFELVAANPQLIGRVKELIVDDTTVSTALLDRRIFRHMASHASLWPLRKVAYFPDDDDESWDADGRIWPSTPDDELHALLVQVYQHHHSNRLSRSDISTLREALPRMTSLRTLVLTNRTADDTPAEGAQSRWNSSPVVKIWRQVGQSRRERPPFAPRVDWWHPIEDGEFDSDQVFGLDWLRDGFEEHILLNGAPYAPNYPRVEELDSDDEVQADEEVARSDDGTDAQELAPTPHIPDSHFTPQPQTMIPAGARTLRRESRGLQIVLDVLNNPIAQSRIVEFRIDSSLDTVSNVQQPGLGIRLFDFWPPPFAVRLATGFSGTFLTKCHLVLSNGRNHTDGQQVIEQGQVGSVLAEIPRLQELKLEAHNMALIGAIPDGFTFHTLRRADFACGLVSRLEIRQFLKAHGETLEEIHLSYCSLDDDDPSWADVVADIMRLQRNGKTHLQTAVITSAYSSIPFSGCGYNRTKTRPPTGEEVYSWTMGVHEDVVPCPTADLGHEALPEP
ncbi:Hypothetical protein NCS54_00859100 [Fusarium falciforme]|uniref:Hypothetical protein n=1 Tax=Fusarium falciforme TaxID=195108 RepID=UPI0023001DE2|nr:Hypothetical protein NCS54_00859100 [Fusarium falciforme]WAO91138.1 Hypothetical protein NCS54_00859100 [Fusarium falciforme]